MEVTTTGNGTVYLADGTCDMLFECDGYYDVRNPLTISEHGYDIVYEMPTTERFRPLTVHVTPVDAVIGVCTPDGSLLGQLIIGQSFSYTCTADWYETASVPSRPTTGWDP